MKQATHCATSSRLEEFQAAAGRSGSAVLLLAVYLGLVAGQGQLLAQKGAKQEVAAAGDKAGTAEPGSGVVDPHAYKIGPEDVLSIKVWREPDLSGQFVVTPDGKITLPLTGEVVASGLTPVELKKVVAEAYGKLVNNPEILLTVDGVRSKKYYMVGQISRAGAIAMPVPIRILDAINGNGGLQEFANQKNIIILRGDKRIKFNYRDVIRGKNLEQNIFLENGDTIIVH